MCTYGRLRPVTLALAACLSLTVVATASAQTRPFYSDEYEGWSRVAHDEGYSAGFERGEADARARAEFNYTRDPEFQRANTGYRRDMTSVDRYRRVFRQGYALGYQEGYRSYSDLRGPRPPSTLPGDVRRPPSTVAFENGFADGYRKGVDDRRDNDRFNPADHDEYRDGDRGFERRYGEREQYRAEYRDGFHAGYTRGYREGR